MFFFMELPGILFITVRPMDARERIVVLGILYEALLLFFLLSEV